MSSSATLYKRVLLVEPDAAARGALAKAIGAIALVEPQSRFESARHRLTAAHCDLLVTNIRLQEFNGLHLVYLMHLSDIRARAIVYDHEDHLGLARDAQRAGAFFERGDHLVITVSAYLHAVLPPKDRRQPAIFERRSLPRGGRRAWDLHTLTSAGLL